MIPFIILFYLHSLYDESHSFIRILDTNFSLIMAIIGVISIIGFFGMRITIKKITALSETIKKSLTSNLDEKAILALAKEEGEVGELADSFVRVLTQIDKREQHPKETNEMIYDILKRTSEVLVVANNYDNLVRLVLETAADALGAKQGALFSHHDGSYALEACTGKDDGIDAEQVMYDAKVYLDQMARENKFFLVSGNEINVQRNKLFTLPLIFSPLMYDQKFEGVLCFSGNNYWNNFSNDHMAVVSNLSHQLAISLANAKLNKNADKTVFETLAALALAVEARDPYSRGHSLRVSRYSEKIAAFMGLPQEDIQSLHDASMLHDIGKIGIKYGVLIKQGKISDEEKSVIRNHPVVGESIALHLKEYRHLLDPIRHHHEQIDGSGYPDGLQGGQISPVSRILGFADIFDTLTENRSYRSGMDLLSARRELYFLEKTGKIDNVLIDNFYHMIDNEGVGRISNSVAGNN